MSIPVIVVHTESGLRDQVLPAIRDQGYRAHTMLTSEHDPFHYARVLRKLWRWPYEYLLCEQDVVPPDGALASLESCRLHWCSHRHSMGTHYVTTTTGLVRWSLQLRRRLPWLMDAVCAAPEPRYWVRRGWTSIPRDCSPTVLNSAGKRACLRPGAPPAATHPNARYRPTTHDWRGIDTGVAMQLHRQGVSVHVHEPPTIHLHDFQAVPKSEVFHWWDEPYDPRFWGEYTGG